MSDRQKEYAYLAYLLLTGKDLGAGDKLLTMMYIDSYIDSAEEWVYGEDVEE
jgi:hypothetical protein